MNKEYKYGLSVLIVDDEEGIRHGLKNLFKKNGFSVYSASNFNDAVIIAQKHSLDAAVVDIRLKTDKNGIELLKELKNIEPDIFIIIITGYGSIDTAVKAMKEGASDYFLKPIDNRKLVDTINKNFQIRDLKNENAYLKNELLNKYINYEFITKNKQLKSIIREVDKIKNNPITILITGESGTGKEVLSEYIHFTSNRKEERFVSINCAALSENLLLSELFGHERGAFTGAIEKKIGKFELANKGTLFLDEIGDMSLDIQSKLLKVIEENSFERVGGIKRINVDARLVTATNKDLKKLIKEGRFRQDLYYRINVVSFNIPPLRDRKEDIPLLSYHLMNKYSLRYNKKSLKISNRAIAFLNSYHWPGNVRELENIVNQAVLLSTNDYLNIDIIKKNISSDVKVENEKLTIDITAVTSLKKEINSIIELYERNIINQFLLKNGFNKSKTARELLITRKTLRQKMKKYNLN